MLTISRAGIIFCAIRLLGTPSVSAPVAYDIFLRASCDEAPAAMFAIPPPVHPTQAASCFLIGRIVVVVVVHIIVSSSLAELSTNRKNKLFDSVAKTMYDFERTMSRRPTENV